MIGAGPVGLLLGTLLRRYDVPFRLIDREAEPHAEMRAAGIQPRSLELLERIGLADRFVAAGVEITVLNTYAKDGRRLKSSSIAPDNTRYAFNLGLQQYNTERLLDDELASLGGEVERDVELVGFEQDDDEVAATLRHDGAEEESRFDYIVGSDGAHSTVRGQLGWNLEGGDYDRTFMVIEAQADWPFPADEIAYVVREEGILVGYRLPQGRTGFFGDTRAGSAAQPGRVSDEVAREFVVEGAPEGTALHKIFWASRYHEHHRCAPAFQQGRAFLAGDAAHICSSIGAQGMNQGFQDAFNLSWKLAHVINHGTGPELLESYGHERKGAAEEELALTDAIYRGVYDDDGSLPHWLGKRYHAFLARFEATRERERRTMAQLNVAYRQSPIVGEHDSGHPGVPAGREHPGLLGYRPFHRGPLAGERLPQGRLTTPGGEPINLVATLAEGVHTLLLMAGAHHEAEEVTKLVGIAAEIEAGYSGLVEPRVVCRDAALAPPAPLGLADSRGEIHHLLGADSDCLYLVRPDLYIGFRARPAQVEPLRAYLDGVLRVSGGK